MADTNEQKRADRQLKMMTLIRDRKDARKNNKIELAQMLSDQIEKLQNERED